MARCKLCLNEKQLISTSHIIPDFMHKDLYDDKHKLHVFNPHERAQGKGYIKKPSTGEYEGGILCESCDNRLLGGIYEDYVSKVMYADEISEDIKVSVTKCRNQHGVEFSKCNNLDYTKYKIFLLSILWRAHISSRPIFSQINLGPHAEIIRKMIYEGDPGRPDDYAIFIMTFVNDPSASTDVIITPQLRRMADGHRVFVFLIAGFIYCFYLNSKSHKIPDYVSQATIKPNNEMDIFHLPKGQSWDFMLGFMGLKKKPSQ